MEQIYLCNNSQNHFKVFYYVLKINKEYVLIIVVYHETKFVYEKWLLVGALTFRGF